jgi:hypothetical protein
MRPSPTRIYRLLSLPIFPVVVVALALMADLMLHPLEAGLSSNEPFWNRWLYGFVFATVNIVIGALCMRGAPGNVIGPLLLIYGAGLTSQSLRASFDPLLAAWIFLLGGTFGWVGFFVLMLLFPDGRPYPRQMRWILIALFAGVVSYIIFYLLGSPRFTFGPDSAPIRAVENPFFFPALETSYRTLTSLMLGGLTPLVVLTMPLSVFMCFRAASPQGKAQIRWILWGVLVMLLAFIAQRFVELLGMLELANTIGAVSTILVFTLPAFAVSNALLRHRLYDIDIIIRKTLIYSLLTGILAVIYFGGVVLSQQVLRTATGETTDLAIVASTLLIAALFRPLRQRIQDTIDRRFYRRKYDAEKTLAEFSQSLRDEVDLDTLKAQMVGVVQDTMQPTKIALWVKD